jgi:hypothetical protein
MQHSSHTRGETDTSEVVLPSTSGEAAPTGTLWLAQVWHAFRPYLIKLSVDLAIFVGFWIVLLAAHGFTRVLPLGSKMSEFLIAFHEIMVVLTFVWISLAATWDLVSLRRKG